MSNGEYIINFFVVDSNGDDVDSGSLELVAESEKDARTQAMNLLQNNYKGHRWNIESITLIE